MAKIRPNWDALQQHLRGREATEAVNDLAERIAEHARDAGIDVEGIPGDVPLPVRVDTYDTDRARATVWLAHPAGLAVQAKHGLLSKAASAAGLEIHSS